MKEKEKFKMATNTFTFTEALLGKYFVNRAKCDLAVVVTAGVPTIIGTETPKIIIEKGLAGSQVLLTQTAVDDLLGVAGDVDVSTAFGSTAMAANNTLGFVLACDGQVESVDLVRTYIGGGSSLGLAEQASSLPDSAFSGPELLVTPAGNLVGRMDDTNLTAVATNTLVTIEMYLRLK